MSIWTLPAALFTVLPIALLQLISPIALPTALPTTPSMISFVNSPIALSATLQLVSPVILSMILLTTSLTALFATLLVTLSAFLLIALLAIL